MQLKWSDLSLICYAVGWGNANIVDGNCTEGTEYNDIIDQGNCTEGTVYNDIYDVRWAKNVVHTS